MANKHTLSLHVSEQYNAEILSLKDTSSYATSPAVSCGRLDIVRPGTVQPVYLDVDPNFDLNLSSEELMYTASGEEHGALPDGVYQIRYSVSPNEYVFVEYYHLRTVSIINQYMHILGSIDLNGCEPAAEIKEKLRELRMIRLYIETAKAKVEVHHDIQTGVNILNYAKKLLDRFGQKCC